MHNFILGLANIALADERVFSVPSVFDAEKELKPLKLGKKRQILLCLMLISKLRTQSKLVMPFGWPHLCLYGMQHLVKPSMVFAVLRCKIGIHCNDMQHKICPWTH
uniref:Uncharacterized protein n=1 Tax=Manihot esculenta TaxID=3983 RepID=A0A2C9WDG1_MANES